MKLSRVALATLVVSLIAGPALGVTKKAVSVGVPGNAPFSVHADGTAQGVIIETADKLLRDMGLEVSYVSMPPSRMYNEVHEHALDVALGTLKTQERAALAHYSDPIITEFNVIAIPKGKAFNNAKIQDLVGKKLGGRTGFRYPRIDDVAGITVERGDSHVANVNKMLAGRLDGVILGSIAGAYELEKAGLLDEVELLPFALGPVPLGIALDNQTFSDTELASVNAAIEAFKASADYQAILDRNGVASFIRQWPLIEE